MHRIYLHTQRARIAFDEIPSWQKGGLARSRDQMSTKDDDCPSIETYLRWHSRSGLCAFRQFKRDFFALARGRFAKDDRYSFFQAYIRMDEGGTGNNAPTLPAQNGGAGGGINPAYTAATTKRAIRMGQAYSFLYDSIGAICWPFEIPPPQACR